MMKYERDPERFGFIIPFLVVFRDDGTKPDMREVLIERAEVLAEPAGRVIDFLAMRARLDALVRRGEELVGHAEWIRLVRETDEELQ